MMPAIFKEDLNIFLKEKTKYSGHHKNQRQKINRKT